MSSGFRIAVDGATSSPTHGAVGIVGFIGGQATFGFGCALPGIIDATTLELLAVRYALLLISCWGWYDHHVQITGDAQTVWERLESNTPHDVRCDAIYREVLYLLTRLPLVSLAYSPREANRVAHIVARNALRYPGISNVLFDYSYMVCL
ncbi:unnamed protein product [Linum trigynum]|uniref:RNase H type-1 domain-containing protein n=1 Tax=Linum trigynum TaxID=586398 RepID=A0AAV2DJB4_9ROSI